MLRLMKNKVFSAFLLAFFLPVIVSAKTVVLIHGFTGNGMDWRTSGFTKPLEFSGWTDGGSYGFNQWGMLTPIGINLKGDVFYTVNLPSLSNIQTQEGILRQYLQHLFSQRSEPITLVGHSAGGVIARLYVLDPMHYPVNALITIASPHLGTPAAKIAYLAGNSPVGMMASFVGEDSLEDGRGLFLDLKEEAPNNFLYWMNHQPHPDIHYASIIRTNDSISKPNKFDFIVPPYSQNMNNIWALRNRSGVALSKDNHSLNGKDGQIVVDVLKHIN